MPDVQNLISLFRLNVCNWLSKVGAYTVWRSLEKNLTFLCYEWHFSWSQLWGCLLLCFSLLLHRRESSWCRCLGMSLKAGWFLMGSAKLKPNPRASRNVCAQRCGSAQCIWGWKYDQFSRFKSAHTNLGSADFQLAVVLLVCQQSWLTVYGNWLFPGFTQFDWSQGCLQSCEGTWTLLVFTKQLSIVQNVHIVQSGVQPLQCLQHQFPMHLIFPCPCQAAVLGPDMAVPHCSHLRTSWQTGFHIYFGGWLVKASEGIQLWWFVLLHERSGLN